MRLIWVPIESTSCFGLFQPSPLALPQQSVNLNDVNKRVSTNPFVWPRKASLTDFRALIRKGNARPSPGLEKWCVNLKSLSDFSLAPVLELHNYMTMNSRFPSDTKDMYLTMFHKRGLRTEVEQLEGSHDSCLFFNFLPIHLLLTLLPITYLLSFNILFTVDDP